MSDDPPTSVDVCIVGGCGRVGLPLGIAFAARGLSVVLYDINAEAVAGVNAATLPFAEPGAADPLAEAVAAGRCAPPRPRRRRDLGPPGRRGRHAGRRAPQPGSRCRAPRVGALRRTSARRQLIVLRSTVYPGVTALTEKLLAGKGLRADVAFCPERIAEGRAMTELFTLPQIVAARTPEALARAEKLFRHLTDQIVPLEPEEAELAKLFTNTWRYIKFATANQFWMMANDFGLDFARIRHAVAYDYPRAADLPMPGFAAGPCLFKDTMQLAAFNRNNFVLGHSAMLINEGLPLYLVSRLEDRFDLATSTVGILGMAFKGGSDDPRESLAYKLRKILALKTRETLCTDPYVADDRFVDLDEVLRRADLLVIAAPHEQYARLDTDKPVIDMWGLTGQGVRV